jgi:glucokinase
MYLGIEIGGTKLQLGVGPGDGTLTGFWRGSVKVARGGEGIREQILQETPVVLHGAGLDRMQIRGVGVGFGGPVDDADQTVIKSHQIQGWNGFPLAKWLSELLGWPVALGNDADVAGLAEALFGAGKGLSPIFYITIGSGIGGGLIIHGEIYRGCGRGAAEIGHIRVAFEDKSIGSLNFPVLEEMSSGWGIASRARTLAQQFPDSLLSKIVNGDVHRLTTEHVARAVKQGDRLAIELWDQALDHLATAICHVVALLCPRRIIIGGGVSLLGEDTLFMPLRQKVGQRVFVPFAKCFDIVPAALREEVVIHGALALARQRFGG